MRRLIVLPLLASALTMAACRPAPAPLSEAQKTAMVDSVRVLSDAMWEAFTRIDLDGGLSSWSPDVVFAVEGTMLTGVQAITDEFRPSFAERVDQSITWGEDRWMVLSPDVVLRVRTADWHVTWKTAGPDSAKVTNTETWQRRDGTWVVVHDHQALISPASQN